MQLAGKTAFVTGAARGIGRACVRARIALGARIAIADISHEAARRTAPAPGDDLTGMAVVLASNVVDCIVVQTYNVDGGQWMS